MTLHHYGFAAKDIIETARQYELIGFKRLNQEIILDPIQNVRLMFLKNENGPLLELVEPVKSGSPVSNILQKAGPTLYHSCYEVRSIAQTMNDLRKKGFISIINPVPAAAFDNRLICFMYHRFIGLIELLEK